MTTTDFDGRVKAPMPTRRTLFMRKFLPYQTLRFALLNTKMLRMVFGGHSDHDPRP